MVLARCDGAWLVVAAVVGVSVARQTPHCMHQDCRYLGANKTANIWDKHYYEVEGNTIEISYDSLWITAYTLQVDCKGVNVLGSPALPRIEMMEHRLILTDCPLPVRGSLAETLATLNAAFCKHDAPDTPSQLKLRNLPATSSLTADYFVNLECLQTLSIHTMKKASATKDFLKPLKNLSKLTIRGVSLAAGALDTLPPSLDTLELYFTGVAQLPESIHSLVDLQRLTVEDDIPLEAGSVPAAVRFMSLTSFATTLRLDTIPPKLETLSLDNWVELVPPPIAHCAALFGLYLTAPAMRALPDGWLANCSSLNHLYITKARHLTTLPPKLFSPGGPLKVLHLRQGALETLPERLLETLESLTTLELDSNQIKILPRNFSFGKYYYKLSRLILSSNDLDGSVFDVLEQLKPDSYFRDAGDSVAVLENWQPPSLNELSLAHNPRIGDVCHADGYSRIRRVISLRRLDLNGTSVSRICRDWREEMPDLYMLDLTNTNITELSYEDLLYKRNIKAQVVLLGAPVTTVQLTREQFNEAWRASPSFASIQFDAELVCDCRTYWTRRALERSIGLLALPDIGKLRCRGGRRLRDVNPDDMMCGARGECAAAALPANCACAARPDDDPHQEQWLVRVRCENTQLGFVLRRLYPFYPSYKSKNEGFYLTQNFTVS